jgi:dephospho-CoA kinase
VLKVGLTGGIASGKSAVGRAFSRLGVRVIDADEIAHEVVRPGGAAWRKLRETFGPEFFQPDGTLNRQRLRRLVFADAEKRSQLNAIVHPEVMREINKRSEGIESEDPTAILMIDIPLLMEVGATDRFDCVVVVYVEKSVQYDRLMKRDGLSKEEASQALEAQMDLRRKAEKADHVIDNSGGLEETEAQVQKVWQELAALARNRGGEKGQTRRPGDAVTKGTKQ